MKRFRIADEPFDTAPLRERLLRDEAGACNMFEGWVRNYNEGRPVRGLRYESYRELAESEGEKILEEACARFSLAQAVCVHRVGELAIGDLAVWVGVSAGHRDMSFEDAAKLLMVSFDSTIKANLSVGLPLDLLVIDRDALAVSHERRIGHDDSYFQAISNSWGSALKAAFHSLPDYSFYSDRTEAAE